MIKINDCYDRILNLYHERLEDNYFEISDETWVLNSNYLRELVNKLDKKINNYEKIKDCLLLLINLCFGVQKPNHYGKQGKSSNNLTNSEKENYRTLLKEEMLIF
ncbi:MAG: hypothetical protein KGD63_11235 [Candidatus Lokiarchaeota archaeon]|nr:hypothetical protein [Candidatus Lokiarchaeota archaeon]